MFKSFVTLFSQANIIFYILLLFTLTLFIIEFFVSSSKIVFRIAGIIMCFITIVTRCKLGNSTSTQIFFYIIYIALICYGIYSLTKLIYGYTVRKKSRLTYTIVDGNKIPTKENGSLDYSFLIGKEGEVVSDLRSAGKANIEDNIYDVVSIQDYVYTGSKVIVEKVEGNRIIVRKVDKGE